MAMTQQALRTVRKVSRPHSFNVGLNLGRSAGGSLSDHLHQHVVPRWTGDANFITVVGGTKTLPQLLEDTRELLADAWDPAQTDRVGVLGGPTLERQDRGVADPAVADLDGALDRLVGVPCLGTAEHRLHERQQRLAVLPRGRVPEVGRAVVDGVVVHAVRRR